MKMGTAEAIRKVKAEPCACIRCSMCSGSGRYRGDDIWDEYECCEDCGGSGITEACERCQLLSDLQNDI